MTTLPPSAHRSTSILGVLAAALLCGAGCSKPPPAATAQPTPPADRSAPRQPTAADFQTFFQGMLPPAAKVSEVKMDPPARLPTAAPGSNAWLLSTKLTVTPTEDLFALPSPQDTQPIDNLVAELNSLVAWRNAYANSAYAKACGAFEVRVPAAPLPQLLVVTHPKDHPLPPVYLKTSAEWQVDHWQFEPLGGDATPLVNAGKLRSEFSGATMVKGSPEAEKAIGGVRDAVAQARKDIEAVRGRYAEQVARGTKPGTLYAGTVSYGANVAPCELRFIDPPPGGDARFASFQVTLTGQNPPCWYLYKARVSTELPIPVPGATSPPDNPYAVAGFNDGSNAAPTHNVFQSLTRSSNFKVGRDTLANWLGENDHGGQALLLLDGRIEGPLNDFPIQLSVQQKP